MPKPNLTYTLSHSKLNKSTGKPEIETFNSLENLPPLACSYNDPYNYIDITYTTDTPLIYYEVRVTEINSNYGIGVGTKVYSNGPNIPGDGSVNSFKIIINQESFPIDTNYRLGLYAKSSASDGFWDVTCILLTTEANGEHLVFKLADGSDFEVVSDQPIPNN